MMSSLISSDALSTNDENESSLSFAVMRGNATVAQVSPTHFLRMFHRGSDEHAELQMRAKLTLQRAFYKYARLYLFARKGYKDLRSFNRMAREQLRSDDDEATPIIEDLLPAALEGLRELSDEDNDDNEIDDALDFMTSDARRNVQAIEAFAILILEIFGAVFALTLGAIGQIQAGYFPDN